MSRASASTRPSSDRPARGPRAAARGGRTMLAGALLLALHLALLGWVSSRQSVTFDESFHLPAGVRLLARGDFASSFAQPPLAKALAGAAALAAGARVPPDSVAGPGFERWVGMSFMRLNADRFQRVYAAGRVPMMLLSLLVALFIWRLASAWFGSAGGLLALGAWCASPEPLAHGSLVGVDVPTALTFFGACLAFHAFAVAGGMRRWLLAAAWFAAAFLTRFSAVQLFPACALLLVAYQLWAPVRAPLRAWVGLAALGLVVVLAVNAGYLFGGSLVPLAGFSFMSHAFLRMRHAFPGLRLPLPADYVRGLDYLAFLSEPGRKMSYALGEVASKHRVWYFPLAIAVKYPVGLLGLMGLVSLRVWHSFAPRSPRRRRRELVLLIPPAVVLLFAMSANLDYGVRYVLPILPFLCVGIGGLAAASRAPRAQAVALRWPRVAVALLVLAALETARSLPYPLSFFNLFAGGPGRGDRIVNDSNVDWGQGLIALRDEMRARGIQRIHLAYHGTVDARLYGIDYVPYSGGSPGPESDWLAVSSYYFVGLPARMTSYLGQTDEALTLDMHLLWNREPVARPAGCMYLFKIR